MEEEKSSGDGAGSGDGGGSVAAALPVIDWGDVPSESKEAEGGAPTINWDIEVEEEGRDIEVVEVEPEKKKTGGSAATEPVPVCDNPNETVLENTALRNKFLNELSEVTACACSRARVC